MSWFATGLSHISQLTEKVQKAIPIDREMLAKLTLNTDAMIAERQQFGEEAKRKAEVKDMLAGMLPWETRDSERDILVEECKEAILALSSKEETFFGPYEMPDLPVTEDDDEEDEGKEKKDGDEEEEDDNKEEEEVKVSSKNRKPCGESLAKLAKLEPLPPLLGDFDLDAHVGLIQKLLKQDPQLVKIQSTLSGGGSREKVFWHNYFFHCAFTRYEAGLSIDEIWSYQPEETKQQTAEGGSEHALSEHAKAEEETVVFDGTTTGEGGESSGSGGGGGAAFPTTDGTNAATAAAAAAGGDPDSASGSGGSGEYVDFTGGSSYSGGTAGSGTNDPSILTDFEMVDDGDDGNAVDAEMDELEAEIAQALGN